MSDFEVAPTGTHQQLCEKQVKIDELERRNEMLMDILIEAGVKIKVTDEGIFWNRVTC